MKVNIDSSIINDTFLYGSQMNYQNTIFLSKNALIISCLQMYLSILTNKLFVDGSIYLEFVQSNNVARRVWNLHVNYPFVRTYQRISNFRYTAHRAAVTIHKRVAV